MKVLYVEGAAADAEIARTCLARSPWLQVEAVGTADEARRRLTARAYDAVLVDLDAPGESRLDLLAWIREEVLPVAVVATTSSGEEDQVARALEAGAHDCVASRADDLERLVALLARDLPHLGQHPTKLAAFQF